MGPTAPPDRLGPRRRANIAGKFARSVDIKKAPSNHDADAGSNRLVAAARRSAIPTLQGRHDELSVGLLPFLAQRRRQMKASTVHATFCFVFAIWMRFAQWAKHPGRKPAATILAVKATIYGLWQRCDGFAKRPDAPSAIRFGLNRFAGPGLAGVGRVGRGAAPCLEGGDHAGGGLWPQTDRRTEFALVGEAV